MRPDFNTSTGLQKISFFCHKQKKKHFGSVKEEKKTKKKKHSPSCLERRERERDEEVGRNREEEG